MTVAAFSALKKQVHLLSKARGLTDLNVRLFEIALEGMGLPPDRRREEVRKVIQAGRDQAAARRAAEEGVEHAIP